MIFLKFHINHPRAKELKYDFIPIVSFWEMSCYDSLCYNECSTNIANIASISLETSWH